MLDIEAELYLENGQIRIESEVRVKFCEALSPSEWARMGAGYRRRVVEDHALQISRHFGKGYRDAINKTLLDARVKLLTMANGQRMQNSPESSAFAAG